LISSKTVRCAVATTIIERQNVPCRVQTVQLLVSPFGLLLLITLATSTTPWRFPAEGEGSWKRERGREDGWTAIENNVRDEKLSTF